MQNTTKAKEGHTIEQAPTKSEFKKSFEYGYCIISNYMQSDKRLTPLSRIIFLEIQYQISKDNLKAKNICNRLNISKPTYFKHKKMLQDAGYLEIIRTNRKEYKYILNMTPKYEYITTNIDLDNLGKYDLEFLSKYANSNKATKYEIETIHKYISEMLNIIKTKWF